MTQPAVILMDTRLSLLSQPDKNKTEPEMTAMPPSQETQLVKLEVQMEHILSEVSKIANQQDSISQIAQAVALHEEKLAHVSRRVGEIDDRFNTHSDNVIDRLTEISSQINDSRKGMDEKTDAALGRVHARLDDVCRDIDQAKGATKVVHWILGGTGAIVFSAYCWAFGQWSTIHENAIRQDERLRILERQPNYNEYPEVVRNEHKPTQPTTTK